MGAARLLLTRFSAQSVAAEGFTAIDIARIEKRGRRLRTSGDACRDGHTLVVSALRAESGQMKTPVVG